ncbi:hypothetical protein KDW55_27885 [Burkholderia sp. AU19243]|uniref:hypothetical protein n=1 Tax=Burkholderia sp. AU19243 TaxID=2824810 RepID=UPI001B9E72F3|nr:hypothetical protein [Burkholderia sp. AU19243]MBR8367147.1 hypothetical protein [Burkholderia sp. AU19243]
MEHRIEVESTTRWDDVQYETVIPKCLSCIHWRADTLACASYPEGVPREILLNLVTHFLYRRAKKGPSRGTR